MTRRRKQLLLGVGLFVGIFASLEIGGRLYVSRARARFEETVRAARVPPTVNEAWPVLPDYYRLSDDKWLVYEPRPGTYVNGALVINSKGYRGREFSDLPPLGTIRILAIGDSCTFGTVITAEPNYTERLESILARADERHGYEVINGGVEGFDSQLASRRLELSLPYRPAIVLIYIGWNDIYSQTPFGPNQPVLPVASQRLVYRSYALRILGRLAFETRKRWERLWNRAASPPAEELTRRAEEYYPARYIANVRRMIHAARASGVEVVLLTLPTLFGGTTQLEHLKRAHYPWFTQDPRLVRALADNYNEQIRQLAAEENVGLADAAAWIDGTPDKGKLFADAYHMYPTGHQILAEGLARQLHEQVIPRLATPPRTDSAAPVGQAAAPAPAR